MANNFSALLTSPLPFVRQGTTENPSIALATVACFAVALLALFLPRRLLHSEMLTRLAVQALRVGGPIPSHVAFIMDGNRRWARRLGLPAHAGHPEGGEKLLESLQWCLDAGVRTVTVYAFSLENYKRAAVEVDEIMTLAERTFHSLADRARFVHTHRVRVRILGDLARVTPSLRRIMARVMADTAHYDDSLTLNICFAYTARHDMASAVHDAAQLCADGAIPPDAITPQLLQACLSSGYGKGASPNSSLPDLLVRTSGETRLSDFLLWESSDSILSFCPTLWPDFSAWDFVAVILDYQRAVRDRKAQDLKLHAKSEFQSERNTSNADWRVSIALEGLREKHFDFVQSLCEEHAAPHET